MGLVFRDFFVCGGVVLVKVGAAENLRGDRVRIAGGGANEVQEGERGGRIINLPIRKEIP